MNSNPRLERVRKALIKVGVDIWSLSQEGPDESIFL